MTSTIEAALPGEAQPDVPASGERSPARAWYALTILITAILFGYINGKVLTLLAGPIKHDLSLTDLQFGELQGVAPAVFGALAMYPLAWLADRTERSKVLCGCVIFWSIATAASGLAWNFPSLLACSIAIMIGEVALIPIVYSLITDLFPSETRPRANIVTYGATVLGAGLGLALGGAAIGVIDDLRPLLPASLQAFEAWRLAFFFISLPGPLVAIAVFSIGRTRRTIVTAQRPASTVRMGPYVRKHGLVALGVYGTIGLFGFAAQGMGVWFPIALIRTFGADAASVGINFGLSFMAGAAVGLVLAAILTPYYRRVAGTAFVLRAVSFAAAAAAVPTALLPFTANIWQAYVLVFFWPAIFVTSATLMPGMMQDIAPAPLRTRVLALGSLFGFGAAISAPLIGFISDQMSGNPRGLMWAMVGLAVPVYLACAVLARFIEAPYRRTVAAIGND